MIQHSSVNHDARRKLGISSLAYILLEYYQQLRLCDIYPPSRAEQARELGFSESAIATAVKEIHERALISEDEYGYQPHESFAKAGMGLEIPPPSTNADEIINLFNSMNGTRYKPEVYAKNIKNLFDIMPDLTINHFEMIFEHKRDQWSLDPKMSQYYQPSTLLSKVNFPRYLDEARAYFLKKIKQ